MKYLALKIDENLQWKDRTHDIATKLSKASALFCKIRNVLVLILWKWFTLQSLIHICKPSMGEKPKFQVKSYCFTEKSSENYKQSAQKSHSGQVSKQNNILKFEDKILIGTIIFVSKSINNLFTTNFQELDFILLWDS